MSISAGHDSKVHQTFQKDPPPILDFSCTAAQFLPVLDLHSSSEQKKSILKKRRRGREREMHTHTGQAASISEFLFL